LEYLPWSFPEASTRMVSLSDWRSQQGHGETAICSVTPTPMNSPQNIADRLFWWKKVFSPGHIDAAH